MSSSVDIRFEASGDDQTLALLQDARRRHRRRRMVFAAIGVVIGLGSYLALSGGGSSSSTSQHQPVPNGPVPSLTGVTANTTCASADIRLSTIPDGLAAGHLFSRLDLENVGTTPCTMSGTPSIGFSNIAGQLVGSTLPGPVTSSPDRVVRLRPDGLADVVISYPDDGMFGSIGQGCRPQSTAWMLVQFASWSRPLTLPFGGSVCTVRGEEGGIERSLRTLRSQADPAH